LGYGEAAQRRMAVEVAANYQANLRDGTLTATNGRTGGRAPLDGRGGRSLRVWPALTNIVGGNRRAADADGEASGEEYEQRATNEDFHRTHYGSRRPNRAAFTELSGPSNSCVKAFCLKWTIRAYLNRASLGAPVDGPTRRQSPALTGGRCCTTAD